MNLLNLAGVRAIYVTKIVLKNKKVKKPIPKGSPRPSSENLALFVDALKANGPNKQPRDSRFIMYQ